MSYMIYYIIILCHQKEKKKSSISISMNSCILVCTVGPEKDGEQEINLATSTKTSHHSMTTAQCNNLQRSKNEMNSCQTWLRPENQRSKIARPSWLWSWMCFMLFCWLPLWSFIWSFVNIVLSWKHTKMFSQRCLGFFVLF